MDFVKKNFKGIVAAFLGLLHFVLLAFPFIGVFAKGMGMSETKNMSGYDCFGDAMKAIETGGGFMQFALIVFLIVAIAMLLIGLYLLLASFLGNKIKLPTDVIGKLCTLIHMGYAGSSLLVLWAAIVVSIANTKTEEFMGITMTAGVSIGFGVIFAVLLAIGSCVAVWIIEKKGLMGISGAGETKSRFACVQCGEVAKKGSAFCCKCGGQVVEIIPTKPMCTVCGAPAKKGDVYCAKCGGKIEEIPLTKPVCEACGAPAKNDAKFCSLCGGKIVLK